MKFEVQNIFEKAVGPTLCKEKNEAQKYTRICSMSMEVKNGRFCFRIQFLQLLSQFSNNYVSFLHIYNIFLSSFFLSFFLPETERESEREGGGAEGEGERQCQAGSTPSTEPNMSSIS